MFLLKISAITNPQKETEFLQAFESAFKKASKFGDLKSSFSKDVYKNYLFHIELSWTKETDLKDYLNSKEYEYLIGALTVLGKITEQNIISTNKVKKIQ
ncbi:MAG: hypothetical protein BMS9Abin39_0382 [Ignavibacteria bacterium]|nr:MAG: hypothetical protein BMS9Abin39_0382 [Ignavibacteria bacterium]